MRQEVKCMYCQETEEGGMIFCGRCNYKVKGYECGKNQCPYCEFKPVAMIPAGRCDECRFCSTSRTPQAGYAFDYRCNAARRTITTYVEYDSEIPPIPEWCPFRIKEE